MKLSAFENRWAEVVLGAIFPACSEVGLSGIEELDIRAHTADVLRRVPFKVAAGFRLALWLVALAPIFVFGRMTTIVRLQRGDRDWLVARLAASRLYAIRSLVLLLKAFGALLYGTDERVRRRMRASSLAPSDGRVRLTLAAPALRPDAA